MRLKDRVALVTGSSRGIGAAIAERLAADGARVVVHGSGSPDRARRVAEKIRSAGGTADVVLGDLATPEAPSDIVRRTFDLHGAIDILVNNAAIMEARMVRDHTAESVDAHLHVNLRATILSSAAFLRLTESKVGRIINISSIASRHSAFGRSVYAATKGAIDSFTRSAAQEAGERGITVNAIAVGTTVTEMFEEGEKTQDRDWRGLFSRWTALRRVGQPQDIADIVSLVASDDARWLTGATIPADGGLVTTGTNIATFTS